MPAANATLSKRLHDNLKRVLNANGYNDKTWAVRVGLVMFCKATHTERVKAAKEIE